VVDPEHGWRVSDDVERQYGRALRFFAECLADLREQREAA
jgi:hypothetical protein